MTARDLPAAVLRFEWRALLRDRLFWVSAAILAGLLVIATVNGAALADAQRRTIAEAQQETATKLAASRADGEAILARRKEKPRGYWNDPSDVRGFGYYKLTTYAVKPPTPLAALTAGSADLLPYTVKVAPGSPSDFAGSYDLENPRRLLLGRFDAAFVVIFLLPLVVAAVAHGVLSGEREHGRGTLLAVHGVSLRRLAFVRLGLRAAALTPLVMLAIIIPALWVGASGGALGAWLAVTAAYAAFWWGLALLVVALSRRAAGAALTLGASWVALVVIGPWALGAVSEALYPSPSRVAQVLAAREAADAAEGDSARALGRYLQDHPEFASAGSKIDTSTYMAARIATTAEVERLTTATNRQFDARLAKRQAMIDRFQWLLPAVLAQQAFVDLSGTGWQRHRGFIVQASDYGAALRDYFEPRALNPDLTFRDWDGWPRFTWREPPVAPALRRAWAASFALLVAGLLAAGLASLRLADRKERRT